MAKPARTSKQRQLPDKGQGRVIEGPLHLFYSDIVNIAVNEGGEVALTFYKALPDPLTNTPKKTALHVQAVAQMPLSLALRLPGLIISQVTTAAPGGSPQVIQAAIDFLQDQMNQLQKALEKAKAKDVGNRS